MTQRYDIGIIGGGPAGYTAALHAREAGLSVVMFEKNFVGGVCLNRGCIPTKTILHSAQLYEEVKSSDEFSDVEVDFEKVIERKDKTVEKLRKMLELTLKNAGVVTVLAEAQVKAPLVRGDKVGIAIQANGETYDCGKVIVATGSKPMELKGLEFDHKFILSSDDVLNLTKLPKSILIVGSGAIGIEWARIFASFGVDVTIAEAADRLLPIADVEVSKRIERIFKSKGIKINLAATEHQPTDYDCVLVAVGRKPNTAERIDGVTYLGDAAGGIQLAHFAIKQAINEVCGIKFDETLVPSVVYGTPEIAWVGAREQDLEPGTYQKANLLVSVLGKSHCDNCSDGFIKLLSRDNKIIGAHIVSKEASALIHQILIAMQNNITAERLKEVCFAHPTYSEGIFECLFRLS
ncbi:MAG: FAD-dependent oxidoreductase [Heliobacteriaceae bacterium]|jgi:dihydrolipoamide dehydrogenase|nr:FAD-dependent oxidoreductase [Heliobacteriaceae bacterium]